MITQLNYGNNNSTKFNPVPNQMTTRQDFNNNPPDPGYLSQAKSTNTVHSIISMRGIGRVAAVAPNKRRLIKRPRGTVIALTNYRSIP